MNPDFPIVITGFMGCGKTEVAQWLATQLGRTAIDLDDVITQREGKCPGRLIEEEGEVIFRSLETKALQNVLEANEPAVIALGGGAWIQEVNRSIIDQSGGISVWLDTPFEICWQRIEASGDKRPLGKTKEQARQAYESRLPVYRQSDLQIEYSPDESAKQLASRIALQLDSFNK